MVNHGMTLRCDDCGAESPPTESNNERVAQKLLVTFHGWRVYPAHEEFLIKKFRRACPKCIQRFAIRKAKERKLAKLLSQENSK